MDKTRFFIAIGPPKTGTSWLYRNLLRHSGVTLPRDKEIHYFWATEVLGRLDFIRNMFGRHWYFRGKRRKLKEAIGWHVRSILRHGSLDTKGLGWDLRYFFATPSDAWYEGLFPVGGLSGDVTPKYCELSEGSIERVRAMVPDCKIIISLRDPVDREWSRAKMNLLKKKRRTSISEVPEARVLEHFHEKPQHRANDYTDLLAKWTVRFPEENVFVFYYDELLKDPQELFDRVCDFLGIDRQKVPGITERTNSGVREPIPPGYLDELVRLNYPFIEKFAEHHPNEFSRRWLALYKGHRAVQEARPISA